MTEMNKKKNSGSKSNVSLASEKTNIHGDVAGRDIIKTPPNNSNITLVAIVGMVVGLIALVVLGLVALGSNPRSPAADDKNSGDPQLSPTHSQQNASPLQTGEYISVSIQLPTIWSPRPDGGWEVQWFFKFQNHADHDVRLLYDTSNFVVNDSFDQLRSKPGNFGCTSQDIVLRPNDTFAPADGCKVILENDGNIDEITLSVHAIAGVRDRDWKFPPPF
jgi:hypothetical protein